MIQIQELITLIIAKSKINIIKEAKGRHYRRLIAKSDNKIKNNVEYS
jgi:hypothetical protein